jgi:hypothetical protein
MNKTIIDLTSAEEAILRPNKGTDRIIYKGHDRWRWEDISGNWEEYYFPISYMSDNVEGLSLMILSKRTKYGFLLSYGDRQGTIAKFSYEKDPDNVGGKGGQTLICDFCST